MGRTKGSGEGSIFKQGKTWRGQILLDGERRSVSGKTKREVADKLAALRVKYNSGELAKKNNVTVKEWGEHWLEVQAKKNMSEQSYIGVESFFNRQVFPILGDYPIQDIDKEILDSFYKSAFDSKKNLGKTFKQDEYAQSTVTRLAIQVNNCLEYAVRNNVIAVNPHKLASYSDYRAPKKVSSYRKDEQEKIIAACKYGKQNEHIFYFLITTGMRFGEAAALTWDDVDLDTGEISINKTAVAIHGSMFVQEKTKTESGMRNIFIGQNVIDWLLWHKSQYSQELNRKNLVFPNKYYNIIIQSNSVKAWERTQKRIGIKHQGMHALRHTWATRALEAGVNIKVVSQMLGHKDIVTTMNIYQDVLDNEKQRAANTLNSLF